MVMSFRLNTGLRITKVVGVPTRKGMKLETRDLRTEGRYEKGGRSW